MKKTLQDIWLQLMFYHQHLANSSPTDFEAQHLTAAHWGEANAEALLSPSTPSEAKPKPVLLTNKFICILTGAQILDTDFFCTTVQEPVQNMLFYYYSCTKKNPKPTNEKTKSVAVFTHNWYASASNRPTSTHPRPSHRLRGQHRPSRTAALSVKRGNSPSPLKDKRSPQANWDNSRLLKKVGHTSCSPMRPPTGSRRILRERQKKKKRYKLEMHKKLGTSLTHFFKLRQGC